jgi:hypothetical protein
MTTLEVHTASTAEELEAIQHFRYSIYVEEMGRYRGTADHDHRLLVDPEDAISDHVYATNGQEIVGSFRLTWGGNGFSSRQIEQYQLDPFLAEIPAERLAVGERTMIAPAWRGEDVFLLLCEGGNAFNERHDIRVVFGACEPHLISLYGAWQRPYGRRNINNAESGYLIPLVCFNDAPEDLAEFGVDGRLPRCVADVLEGTGTITSAFYLGDEAYTELALRAVARVEPSVFDGLTPGEIARCIERSTIVEFHESDLVVKAGGSAHNMFVVLEGAFEISRDGTVVGRVQPGDILGEIAHLLDQPRGADARAVTDGRVLALSEGVLRKLTDREPAIAAKFHRNIAKQLGTRLQMATAAT